jgi:hypothetical protein
MASKELSTLEYNNMHPKHIPTTTKNQIVNPLKFDFNSCLYKPILFSLPNDKCFSPLARFMLSPRLPLFLPAPLPTSLAWQLF